MVGSSVAEAVAGAEAEADPEAGALGEGEPLGEALAVARADAGPPVPGVDPVLVVADVDRVAGAAVDGFGAAVVLFGVDVAEGLAVGAGWLVAVGSGGATRGCWPDPKRKPTTVPGPGL